MTLFRLCNRNFGVGGDGVIFALKAPEGESHSNIVALCDNNGVIFTDVLIPHHHRFIRGRF